jgi:hypothetical protein
VAGFERGDRALRELLPGHGSGARDGSLVAAEPVEARHEQRLDRRRNRRVAIVLRQDREHLLDEEGVAVGRARYPLP